MANTTISDLYYDKTTSGITTSTAIQGKNANELTMDDFFTLLTAQMSNQDVMNPQETTDFIAQMAQFSSLQGMKNLLEYQQSANAVSYTGKTVTIAEINETTQTVDKITGVVEQVTFYDGVPKVWVNGKAYEAHKIMEVHNPDYSGNSLNQVASYIGKQVTVTDTSDPSNPKDYTGIVGSVTLKGGMPYVIINGREFAASAITFVGDAPNDRNDITTDLDTDTDTDADTDADTDIDIDTDADTNGSGTEPDDNSGLDTDDE